ncbi:hypothetical protein JCM11251_003252 [Rhodosporidiobolus azoricus]
MAQRGIPVAYEALPSTADYEMVRADVERQLPLRNLHWVRKSGASRTIRTIQALPLHFRPLEAFSDARADLLERPYLHLLFVVCDDSEVYRATLRTQIREWLDSVTSKQHHEWLIVHVTSGRGGVAKFYQRKGSIVDKIKADFNIGKKDRCVQVVQGSSVEDPTAWAEFLTKVKEGVVATLDANVALYEENVRKADSQRQLQGWQFLPFFRQKENLADSFEAMSLFEDALIQYDELEASFFQSLKEHRNAAWYDNLGGTTTGDDSLPLLSTASKPYRRLIESSTISVFDFRIYVFARQATMLFHLGRVVEVARRGAYFVSTFARTLREHQALLGVNFVESWTYSACLDLVQECQRRIGQDLANAGGTAFIAVKAELLDLARKQLDKIGMGVGHLPTTHPFAMSLNESSPTSSATANAQTVDRPPVTRRDLTDGVAHQESFDKLYINLTHRAIQAYQSSGRKRFALRLHAYLAALDQHRHQLETAQKLYSQLPAHYSDGRWSLIESYLLKRCTSLQSRLDMPKDRLLSTLALVQAGMARGSQEGWNLAAVTDEMCTGDADTRSSALAAELMDDVYRLSAGLSKDFAAVAFPSFSVHLQEGSGSRAVDEDGLTATVKIRNHLPCALKIDGVRLKFSTSSEEQVWLTAGACKLAANGETPIVVFCPTTVTGRLRLELSQLRFSRIIFQYSHRPPAAQHPVSDIRLAASPQRQPYLTILPDHQAVHVELEEPDAVHLDRDRKAVLVVDSGRNDILRAVLRLVPENEEIFFVTTRAELTCGGEFDRYASKNEGDGTIVFENLRPFEQARVRIPLAGNICESVVQFTVQGEYTTSKRPQSRRHFRRSFAYSIALPLAVNVQDYFREHCLLSKFSVTTDGVQGVHVRDARIEAPPNVTVKACRAPGDAPLFVSPLQTANFLFKLACDHPEGVTEPLRLVLVYASLEQQLCDRVTQMVNQLLDGSSLRPQKRWVRAAFIADALSATPLSTNDVREAFSLMRFNDAAWRKRTHLCTTDANTTKAILRVVEELYMRAAQHRPGVNETSWRTLEIPLDLPSLHVLSLVRMEPAVNCVEVGQPVPVTMYIRCSFRWRRKIEAFPIRLAYQVISDAREWAVSGQARGEFIAKEDEELAILLTFVPLEPAALFLPSVAITPVASSASTHGFVSCETQYVTAAQAVEVLPIVHRATFEVVVPLAVA